jgi:hypothetical protein
MRLQARDWAKAVFDAPRRFNYVSVGTNECLFGYGLTDAEHICEGSGSKCRRRCLR